MPLLLFILYSLLVIYAFIMVSKYCFIKPNLSLSCSITVVPFKNLIIWGNEKLLISKKIFTSDKNGLITFVVNTSTYDDNIYKEKIYYRFVENNSLLSIQHTLINSGKSIGTESFVSKFNVDEIEPIMKVPIELPYNIASNQTIGNVIDEQLDNSFINRVKTVNDIDTPMQETCADKAFNMPNLNHKLFKQPLEAILDNRFFRTKFNHNMIYENTIEPEKIAKFT